MTQSPRLSQTSIHRFFASLPERAVHLPSREGGAGKRNGLLGVSLSRSKIAAHSASPRQNHRSSLTIGPLPPNVPVAHRALIALLPN